MLWRIRIRQDVLFFVKKKKKNAQKVVCVYVSVCHLEVWELLISTLCNALIVWWVDLIYGNRASNSKI